MKLSPTPIIILALFVLSLACALFFLYSPVVPYPTGDPTCGTNKNLMTPATCEASAQKFLAQGLMAQASSDWHLYVMWGAVGFAVLGAVLSLHLLRSRFKSERASGLTGLVILAPYLVFATLYLLMVGMLYEYLISNVTVYAMNDVSPLGNFGLYGAFAVFLFLMASGCLVVFYLGRGFWGALVRVLRVFAVPGVLLLEFVVLTWDRQEMGIHVTNFAPAWLNNWVVLTVVLGLAVVVYIPPVFRLAHFRHEEILNES